MIGMLTGTCLMAGTGEAIIDVNGVGYLLQCGSRTLGSLGIGETVCLHVETHVREQAITLYGFHSEEERAWFVRLQTCLLYTSPSPRDRTRSRMPSSA